MTDDVHRKAEKFLDLFNKGKEFTEELLRENQRLRYRLAALESSSESTSAGTVEMQRLRDQVQQLSDENRTILERFRKVEAENKDFASRYIEIEEQNNNLANLYVASYQLHSTLDFREVIQIVQEIIINLVGAESFAILLLDEKTNDFRVIAAEGTDVVPGIDQMTVRAGEGMLGEAVQTGESRFNDADSEAAIDRPLAAVPLKIKDHTIGLFAIYKLLQQKHSFSAVDFELFSLLAAQAATAIFSSKLYSQSERKLNTIQGFLDLLTTN